MDANPGLSSAVESVVPTVTASYKWTRDEFVKAQQSHVGQQLRPSLKRAFVGLILFIFVMMVWLAFTLPPKPSNFFPALMALGAFLLIAKSRALRDWIYKRLWNSGKLRTQDVLMRFDPDAITMEAASANTTMRWNAFVSVTEAPEGFLLYSQARIFHWVPFHAFEDARDIEQVRRYIVHSELPFKKMTAPKSN